jgi:NADP-dependent 3-hydroxy acid dehydrogenase YdfG
MDLKNKVVVVTGASKGIGLATAKAFLAAGLRVSAWSRSEMDDLQENDQLQKLQVDVRKPVEVKKAIENVAQYFGESVSILINNAGLGFQGLLEEMPEDQWHQMFDTNVHGLYYCTKAVLPQMKKSGYGHIVNIASIAATNGIETMSGYCATKFAVRGISHSLFKEVRNHGIKVTCIYPGSVNTHFFDAIDTVTANENMMRPQDIAETIVQAVHTFHNYHIVDIEMRPLKPKG